MNAPTADSDTPVLDDDFQRAVQAFLPEALAREDVPHHPDLLRVITPSGVWRVRRWPQGTPHHDLVFSHEVMARAHAAGLEVVPRLLHPTQEPEASAVRIGQRFYDAQQWLPGEPPTGTEIVWPRHAGALISVPLALPAPTFTTAIATLAQLHEATSGLSTAVGIPAAPLHHLPGAVRQAQARHLGLLRGRARHEPAIQRWIATGERLIAAAEPQIMAAAEGQALSVSVLHLDMWPAHLLLAGEDLVGLLGWNRAAAGSPLLDLAQAILRLQGWTDEAVERTLGAYGDLRHLAPHERRLLPAVAALDAVAVTGRLLEQTFAGGGTERPPQALRAAIDMMLRSMTAIDRNLHAPSEKSTRRTWDRSRPRPGGRTRGGSSRDPRR